MRYWGGEALSFSSRSPAFEQHLEKIGVPAVVAADLDLSEPHKTHLRRGGDKSYCVTVRAASIIGTLFPTAVAQPTRTSPS